MIGLNFYDFDIFKNELIPLFEYEMPITIEILHLYYDDILIFEIK